MKKPSYATLQRKIRRLQDLVNKDSVILKHNMEYCLKLEIDNRRISNLLQAYKDRETDKAHRLIRKDP